MKFILRWLFATLEFKAAVKAAIENETIDGGVIVD